MYTIKPSIEAWNHRAASNLHRKQGSDNTILNPFDRQTVSAEISQGE